MKPSLLLILGLAIFVAGVLGIVRRGQASDLPAREYYFSHGYYCLRMSNTYILHDCSTQPGGDIMYKAIYNATDIKVVEQ